jgi:glycosyltransferase involved in cell wall biosynthesis
MHERTILVPNGVNDLYIKDLVGESALSYDTKENLIITVGRIGDTEKNTSMLLRVIEKIVFRNNWTIAFIGPIEDGFNREIDEFFARTPTNSSFVQFVGNVANRQELFKWYARSKVFCLTSLSESFCIALVEAMYFANYVVTTNCSESLHDITKEGSISSIVDLNDIDSYVRILQDIIDGNCSIEKRAKEGSEHVRSHYSWHNIVGTLQERISSIPADSTFQSPEQ